MSEEGSGVEVPGYKLVELQWSLAPMSEEGVHRVTSTGVSSSFNGASLQ